MSSGPRAYRDCLQTLVGEPYKSDGYWRVKLICGHSVHVNYRPRRNRRVFCAKCEERNEARANGGAS